MIETKTKKQPWNGKLTPDQVREIRRKWKETDVKQTQLCVEYGVGYATMQAIIHRRIWKNVE